jgi:hypothetical protein
MCPVQTVTHVSGRSLFCSQSVRATAFFVYLWRSLSAIVCPSHGRAWQPKAPEKPVVHQKEFLIDKAVVNFQFLGSLPNCELIGG